MRNKISHGIKERFLLVALLLFGVALYKTQVYSNQSLASFVSSHQGSRNEVLFVTAIYGTYEKTIKPPQPQTIPARFVAFTDREDLVASPGWEVHLVKDPAMYTIQSNLTGWNDLTNNKHPFNRAKVFKQQFHNLPILQDHRIAIWLDATVHITNRSAAETIKNLVEGDGRNIVIFEHKREGFVGKEAHASRFDKYFSTHWGCCDQPMQNVTEQYDRYSSLGFQERWWLQEYDAPLGIGKREQYGLWVTCFVAFDTLDPVSRIFLDA